MINELGDIVVAGKFGTDQRGDAEMLVAGRRFSELFRATVGVFTNMATVDFIEVRVNVTADGKTSFVQANGRFTTADGRPYQNVYIIRYDWNDGRLIGIEEYGSPVTFCETFGHPNC